MSRLFAALVVALLAVAGCSSGPASAPTVVIGTKEFTEQWVIGQLWSQALEQQGYQVEVKNNIGSTNIIDRALSADSINVYPEYTGVILQVLAERDNLPHTSRATYEQARQFERHRGLDLLSPTPFQNTYAVAVRAPYAKKHHLRTISDLRRVGPISYAEYPDNIDTSTGYAGLVKTYGLDNMKVVSLNLGLQYKALAAGDVQAADVFTTDPQLLRANLTLLKDTENIFGWQNLAPVVSPELLRRMPPSFERTIGRIDALLTPKAIRTMNRAVAVNRLSPAQVARKFLEANRLV